MVSSTSSFFFPPFRLELSNERLWWEDKQVPLRRKTFAVLQHLVERHGQLVTKAQLFDAVWPGTYVGEVALTICITELRKALGDDSKKPRFIETVRGRGYRFIAEVQSPKSKIQSPKEEKSQISKIKSQNYLRLSPQHSAFVGRNAELAQLHHWLDKALHGERQIIFVSGEPGIGKTTLLEIFLRGLRNWELGIGEQKSQISKVKTQKSKVPDPRSYIPHPGAWVVGGQCIEHYGAGEAYLPILEALGRLCRETDGERLIDILQQYAPTWLVQMPALLSASDLETLQRKTSGTTRERMLRELAEALEVITTERPFVLVLEDLHWSDVSTLACLAFIARRKEHARLLVIGTYRPMEMLSDGHPLKGIIQELYAHGLATELALGLLNEADIESYLDTRFNAEGRRPIFLTALTHLLHFRTDGNPLFLVSLVNDLIERDTLVQTDNGWELKEEIGGKEITVPDSIRHLVARQYGRLSSEKRNTLEAASVAGLEFSAAAVAAALATESVAVERQCEELAEHQQFLTRLGVEEWPDGTLAARYRFLHALYQQLWHERVSPTQLQQYHLSIGERKERAYGKHAREIAAELALHFEQGRDFGKAVQYIQYAGTNALQRSAYQEAITLLTKGLELLRALPAVPERAQQEITLQTTLGAPLIATKGYAAPEVGQTYARARELCQEMGDPPQLFTVLWGLWAFSQVRAELATTRVVGTQLLQLAHRHHSTEGLVGAHLALGEALFLLGELSSAREHLEECLALYVPQRHTNYTMLYGLDPGVFCLSWLPHVLWHLGYPDQALRRNQELLRLARTHAHPFSLAFALDYAAMFHQFRGDSETASQLADTAVRHCTEHGFALYLAWGKVLQGWVRVARGEQKDGIKQLSQGIADWQATGAALRLPYYLALLAEAQGNVGQGKEGLSLLNVALAQGDKTQEQHYEAELYRLKGELMLAGTKGWRLKTGPSSPQASSLKPLVSREGEQEAEEYFRKAIDIARKQQAKSLELRAVMSLVRLRQHQAENQVIRNTQYVSQTTQHKIRSRLDEAHNMLVEIYHWFTEGFDTKDLQEAKALLEELSH